MSKKPENIILNPSISFAGDSHARTSLAQERARVYLESAQACGLSLPGLSRKCAPNGSSSKMSQAQPVDGLIPSEQTWNGSAMKRYRSLSRRKMSELRTEGEGFSLLPTPSASSYGSNQEGAAGRTGKKRHSLQTLAKRGELLATPTAKGNQLAPQMKKWASCRAFKKAHPPGPLHPQFVEWMMGFPKDWTEIDH